MDKNEKIKCVIGDHRENGGNPSLEEVTNSLNELSKIHRKEGTLDNWLDTNGLNRRYSNV